MPSPLRGRLMVGRLTLDQVVKVRVLAPQPHRNDEGRTGGGLRRGEETTLLRQSVGHVLPRQERLSSLARDTKLKDSAALPIQATEDAKSSCGSGNDRQHVPKRQTSGGRQGRRSSFRPPSLPCAGRAHSSSGLGRRPLTAVARVRIPYAPFFVWTETPALAAGFRPFAGEPSAYAGSPSRPPETPETPWTAYLPAYLDLRADQGQNRGVAESYYSRRSARDPGAPPSRPGMPPLRT